MAIMLHQKDGGAGRIDGSDGQRLFIGSYPMPTKTPSMDQDGDRCYHAMT